LEIGTTHKDIDGNIIPAARAHSVSASNFDDVIETALSTLCAKIDWSPLSVDKTAPFIDEATPVNGTTVPIHSNVYIKIKDNLPSSGIDLSGLKVTLNNGVVDFDITNEVIVDGDPYIYTLNWSPPLRVYSRYDS
jgi:hypothetical protein